MQIETLLAEVNRRLDDPARPPMQLRTEPLTPAEVQHTLAVWESFPRDQGDRLYAILEDVVNLPEPEQTRAIEAMYIAIDVIQEQHT